LLYGIVPAEKLSKQRLCLNIQNSKEIKEEVKWAKKLLFQLFLYSWTFQFVFILEKGIQDYEKSYFSLITRTIFVVNLFLFITQEREL